MPAAVQERTAPQTYMQGIAVPAEAVQPDLFFKLTRRHTMLEKSVPFTGQSQETFELRKSDVLSSILVRFSGQLVVAAGTTVTSSARWPYDFITTRFTANGASNIINCGGLKLKIRDVMKNADLTDRGITQTYGGVARNQGTLARASESWGVGSATSAIAPGTYDVELEWHVPVAEDERDLSGAIFLATSSSDLTLTVDLRPISELFTSTGAAPTLTGSIQAITTKFSIPVYNGSIVVPDLSLFHSLIQSRVTNTIQNGETEHRLIGQGAGKSLLRVFGQVYNGAGFASTPLSMTRQNFGRQMWRYGNNETPEEYIDGHHMRIDQERRYNSDVGALWGVFCHDFAHENVFRDVVDLGTTSELRLVTTVQNSVALNAPALEYCTETLFFAGQG
jgi:hypothetical protein